MGLSWFCVGCTVCTWCTGSTPLITLGTCIDWDVTCNVFSARYLQRHQVGEGTIAALQVPKGVGQDLDRRPTQPSTAAADDGHIILLLQ
jgi:hypothetical protein